MASTRSCQTFFSPRCVDLSARHSQWELVPLESKLTNKCGTLKTHSRPANPVQPLKRRPAHERVQLAPALARFVRE